ncbi:HMA2 domain-containing protein [Sinorhizobium chiapasense]|uniref:Uncharacterized protein n=1 Tax=Sinorhizobium chiapasense TaxID=501572 RepID=A0ABZ2B3Q9_9HYPH
MIAQIVHYTPGRLRIKIPAARHQTTFFADLQQQLVGADGVLSVTVNPTAASLVIVHDIAVDPLALCREIPGLAVTSSAVHPHLMGTGRADNLSGGRETDLVSLLAKLLPLVFARHPLAQLAEPLAEPILRAAFDSLTQPTSYPLPVAASRKEEDVIAIAA